MRMKIFATIIVSLLSCTGALLAITPEELKAAQAEGERITIVDIRDSGSYRIGHIAGAISVPLEVCAEKSLPPLGRVAVCGDGLDTAAVDKAVTLLSAKTGINAEALEGGIMRWQELGYPYTGKKGMVRERPAGITYRQLQKAAKDNKNVVLVDLRKSEDAVAREAFSDLDRHFPGTRTSDSPFAGAGRSTSSADVYVLIDNGDGEAQKTAKKLRAAGIRRFVILLGGEEMIKRRGAPGVVREVVE
jgi:rhodanese-related sulfurtransferase